MNLLREENFRNKINGSEANLFTLRNSNGCVAQFSNYGARWLSMWVPDKNGVWEDVVLGFDRINQYITAGEKYHGAIVGRTSGRLDAGKFMLNEVTYSLANNDLWGKPLKNHLHGGKNGFSFQVWTAGEVQHKNGEQSIGFHYESKDGEEGYPGNLSVSVTYTLSTDNAIRIDYQATTDKVTVVNLTSHAYFNLSGDAETSVLDHLLYIPSAYSPECNEELIPTGEIISVKNTPIDFTRPQPLGSRIQEDFPGQLFAGKGYVAGYVIDQSKDPLPLAAQLTDPKSGRQMELFTDQPFLQLYNAWLFDGSDIGKGGKKYQSSCGVALEPQGFNDAPNHENFPSIVLRPGEVYRQRTVYRFSVKE